MTDVLRLRALTSGYSGVPVLRGLDMHVGHGEIVALLGPNGAGKTTTLMTISQLVAPISGEVLIAGAQVNGMAPHAVARLGVAHVPEDRSLFFQLTVAENLKVGASSGAAAFDRAVEFFPELVPLLDRRAGLLSGGEQQMLAIARALAGDPALLMIDEMSLGLAPIIVERLLPVLRRVASEIGTAIVLVEQHVQLALDVADRAYVLNHGELVVEGAADDLAENRQLLEDSYLGDVAEPGAS